jgi:hypothetical protein
MQKLLNCGDSETYFALLNKLEGLHSLIKKEDFSIYRRTIFDCLNLMNVLKGELCR